MNDTEPGSRVGSRFGPYQLERLLGSGRLGEVYAAQDTRTDQAVALKLFSEELSGDEAFRGRLEEQAAAAGRLTEPHLVSVLAYGQVDGVLYLEMRLIDGTDLATLLAASGPLSPPRTAAVVRQVAAALEAAHDADLVHGDVRPGNILVTDDDFAYLTDIGVADAGGVAGDEDAAGDVRALAAVLAECLTGEPVTVPPAQPYPQPSKLRPGRVPAALDDVIARGLADKPDDGYGSAGELAGAAFAALTPPEQHQATRILRRSEHGAALVSGAVAESRTETPVHSAPRVRTWGGWTPPDAGSGDFTGDVGDFGSAAAGLLGMAPLLRPDLGPTPLRIPGASRRRLKRKPMLVGTAVLLAGVIVAGVGYLASKSSAASPVAASPQVVLPFDGQDYRLSPGGIGVDGDGNAYVSSEGMHGKVVKLPAGSGAPSVLPFSDSYQPRGLAVDGSGNVYFSDRNNRVVKVAPEAETQTVLPFVGLENPDGVAVDGSGNVYVADRGNNQVVKLEAGSNTQTALPFIGLDNPDGVAVDASGNVYVTDTDNNRVLKLTAGSGEQVVLPFAGIVSPWGIAVDDAGGVYVTEHNRNRVVKLAAGSAIPVVLPFTGLNAPLDVAVDKHGNVYVADRGNDRVVKVVPEQ